MNKILLISIFERAQYINLGISQLAGYLRGRNYYVTLKFYNDNLNYEEILYDIIALGFYDYYGFSVYQANVKCSMILTKEIKNNFKNAVVFWGGAFATTFCDELLNDCKELDYIILGDGEEPLAYLLEENCIDNYPYIAQQGKKKQMAVFYNKLIEWDVVYDFYENHQGAFYIHNILTKSNVCTGCCTFCCTRKSGEIIYKPLSSIIEEICYLHRKYKIQHFNFVDDDIFDGKDIIVGKKRIEKLCDSIIALELNVYLYCYCKVTDLQDNNYDNQLLDKMKSAGFITIFIGVESGNSEDLKLFNKKNTVDDNYKALNLLKKHSIPPTFGFISFHPYSTIERIKENFLFLVNVKSLEFMHYTTAFLVLYKGSPLYNKVVKDNLLKETYSYMSMEEYYFIDDNVAQIAQFIHTYFDNSEFKDIYGWHRFYIFFESYACKYIEIEQFRSDFEKLKKDFFSLIVDYFYHLYIENDIKYCEDNFETFRERFFENNYEMEQLKNRITKSIFRITKIGS